MALPGPLRPRKVRRRRELLLQQIGFVCAVLALACCAPGLFGSPGRCRCGPTRELGGLGWAAAGSSEMSPPLLPRQVGPKGSFSPLPAGLGAHPREGWCGRSERRRFPPSRAPPLGAALLGRKPARGPWAPESVSRGCGGGAVQQGVQTWIPLT